MSKFALGHVSATKVALAELDSDDLLQALARHRYGDWGNLTTSDKKMNDNAVKTGQGRIFSKYQDRNKIDFYIITEADRSATTILLPSEY